jgi:hypothetical protein
MPRVKLVRNRTKDAAKRLTKLDARFTSELNSAKLPDGRTIPNLASIIPRMERIRLMMNMYSDEISYTCPRWIAEMIDSYNLKKKKPAK